MKIVSVVGARPQFIKIAPLAEAIEPRHEHVIVHTGQHYDLTMDKVFFDELHIPEPRHNLGVGSGTHAVQTANVLVETERLLIEEKPDLCVVYGDTNSTLAGALAAAKLQIPVAHVEAGPRTFDLTMPEEINRVMADHAATLLFCPTENCVENCRRERLGDSAYFTGDVMYDCFVRQASSLFSSSRVLPGIKGLEHEFVLATIHRHNNTDDPRRLEAIFSALIRSESPVIVPLHPRTRTRLRGTKVEEDLSRSESVQLIEPLSYLDFVLLESRASLIMTDSGGVQKEAYFLKKSCITVYEHTAWPETVRDGWNRLVPPDRDQLVDAMRHPPQGGDRTTSFGDGMASERIVEIIDQWSVKRRTA